MKVNDRLWTVQDVAEFLGIPVGTLYDLGRCKGYGPKGKRMVRYLRVRREGGPGVVLRSSIRRA